MESGKGPLPILGVNPLVIVGAQVDGKPDFATLAWTGVACSAPPCISIALQPHRHSLKGIRQNMAFSINIPSTDMVKETDYCGIVSGAVEDKVKDCHFTLFYGENRNAPFIGECPVNHACAVIQILNLGSHVLVVGRIVETHVSSDCLTQGRPDTAKIKPLLTAGMNYYGIDARNLGVAFQVGKTIKPGAQLNPPRPLRETPQRPPGSMP